MVESGQVEEMRENRGIMKSGESKGRESSGNEATESSGNEGRKSEGK